jgi:CHASE2 domain-containing sensor protein
VVLKAAPPAPPGWHQALRESALAVLVFIFLSWAATGGQLGWFSDTLADIQDKAYDTLAKLEYNFSSPKPPAFGTRPVVFVDIDEATVKADNPSPYLFHRGLLSQLLTKVGASHPRAVYVDLNLSFPSQEPDLRPGASVRAPRSAGDTALFRYLDAPHGFPLLLSQPVLFGEPLSALHGSACWVTPSVVTDSGATVRRIPRRWQDGPYPAAEALFRAAQGQFRCSRTNLRNAEPPKNVYRTAIYGEPIIFHRIQAGNTADGVRDWPDLSVVSAGDLLRSGLSLEPDVIVLVGRTDRASSDLHNSAVGVLPGIDLHLNALLTLLAYHHALLPLNPFVSALYAFLVMLFALLAAPVLSSLLTRLLERRGLRQDFGTFFEHPIMWGLLYLAAFLAYRYSGRFLDFALPIVSLEFGRLILHRQTGKLVNRTLKMSKLLG